MIPRYSRPEMAKLWSDESRFGTWLRVEIAATEVLTEMGVVALKLGRNFIGIIYTQIRDQNTIDTSLMKIAEKLLHPILINKVIIH